MSTRALLPCLFFLFTVACSDKEDTDVETGITDDTGDVVSDADEDGYTIEQGDCNDNDATIHPEADETCNDIDDNCSALSSAHVKLAAAKKYQAQTTLV